MNLNKIVRNALITETEKKRKYDYGCVMLGLKLNKEDWQEIQDYIDEEDIFIGESKNGGAGREMDPHITLLFGVHEDVPDEDVESIIEKIKVPELEFKSISIFSNDEFDVLKYDIESEDLQEINKMLKELPHTSSFPTYHAHCTIAYLKKGKGEEYVKKMKDVEPFFPDVNEILYSKPVGPKKHYKF